MFCTFSFSSKPLTGYALQHLSFQNKGCSQCQIMFSQVTHLLPDTVCGDPHRTWRSDLCSQPGLARPLSMAHFLVSSRSPKLRVRPSLTTQLVHACCPVQLSPVTGLPCLFRSVCSQDAACFHLMRNVERNVVSGFHDCVLCWISFFSTLSVAIVCTRLCFSSRWGMSCRVSVIACSA